MAGIKGMTQELRGMSDKEVLKIVEKQYASFCNYRYMLASNMPDWKINTFDKRIFTGSFFERSDK